MTTLRDALAPGSYLILGHLTDENMPKVAHAAEKVYNRSVATNVRCDIGMVMKISWQLEAISGAPPPPGKRTLGAR